MEITARTLPAAIVTLLLGAACLALEGAPDWLVKVADFFPLSHVVNAFGSCFAPGVTGSGFSGGDLLVIAA